MNRKIWLTSLIGLLALGCGDDTTSADTDTDGETEESTSTTSTTSTTTTATTIASSSTTEDPDTDTEDPPTSSSTTDDPDTDSTTSSTTDAESSSSTEEVVPLDPVEFTLTIENVSADTVLPSPFSPGFWAEHSLGTQPIFDATMADRGNGLVEIAEDGNPDVLAASAGGNGDIIASGIFETPVGGAGRAPIMPGESYEVTFTAQPGSRLSFVSMLVETNDIFVGTGPNGISLFNNAVTAPLPSRDISDALEFWDVGSEANQPPAGGMYQAPHGVGIGPDESGAVSLRNESTHAIPQAPRIANVEVTFDAMTGIYTIEIQNTTDANGGILTPLSPIVWAMHDDTASLFTPGMSADGVAGLEALAEDGMTGTLVTTLGGVAGVDQVDSTNAGTAPGSSTIITVTPAAAGPFFSFATMVVESNDAFLATLPSGVALLDDMGMPRSVASIEADFRTMLAVWDAGTEENQAPGVGPDTQPNQDFANSGNDDALDEVRYYLDPINDFAGDDVGGTLSVEVINGANPGDFDVTITNTSGGMPFQGVLTPVAWYVHDGATAAFTMGMPASPGLEELAEDGEAAAFSADMGMTASQSMVNGAAPVPPGGTFTFSFTTTAADSFFNFASMIVPSNDTFVALGDLGVDLYGGGATPLTDGEIATAITAALNAYDAGTEANQGGGAGRDMAPGPLNTGVDEGNGLIRQADEDPVWDYPAAEDLIRVTIAPTER